jgi:hypothetical protein
VADGQVRVMGRPRQTACAYGHPLGSPANTRYNANGAQKCAACGRRHSRQYRIRQQARRENKPATVALIVWVRNSREFHAAWTFHPSRAAAAELAPDDCPFTIIDVAVARRQRRPPKLNWPITGAP